jgi:transcriptional regulator NrdR family protein
VTRRDGPATCRCGGESRVLEVRQSGNSTRRRRECKVCSRRWTTREVEEAMSAKKKPTEHYL